VGRLTGIAVLILGSAGALAVPAAASAARVSAAPAGAVTRSSGLWHPTAFGHDAGLGAGPAAAPAVNPATASAGWHPETTPNPTGTLNGTLLAESCGAATSCEAVGDYYNATGDTVTLAERWVGRNWFTQATPALAGVSSSQLNGVSCLSPRACTAAGYETNRAGVIVPLVETWNGSRWSTQSVPAPSGSPASGFFAISCASASACTAVGDTRNPVGQSLPLAERWNGTTWTVQAMPNPSGAQATGLFAVSCATATACTTTGAAAGSSGIPAPLAEAWNGTTWTVKTTPVPSGAVGGELDGVACVTPAACTSVGYADAASGSFATLAERWNGTAWRIQATPVPAGAGASALLAVSCTSATMCTAGGAYVTKTSMPPLAEGWNGTAWSVEQTADPPRTRGSQFNAIACAASGTCTAVGQQASMSGGVPRPLGETGGASGWTSVVAEAPTGAKLSQLIAVSCPAADDCMAVGSYEEQFTLQLALAETWNGTRWTIEPAASPSGATATFLDGVSCTSADACTAVGYTFLRGERYSVPVAETWNGTAWTIQPTPFPAGARQSSLYGISCTAADACVAVGVSRTHGGGQVGLAEQWNGTAWSIQDLGAAAKNAFLSGVSCPAAGHCVASGYVTGAGNARPLALAWNGTSWRSQPVPLPAHANGGTFSAVSCTSVSSCMATGTDFAEPGGAFGEYWNGSTWHPEAAPNPPLGDQSMGEIGLVAVSCTAPDACEAMGDFTPNGQPEVFAETWDGSHWHLQHAGLPKGWVGVQLSGLSCTTAGCTTVGYYFGDSNIQVTLALGTSQSD
jgi:hypothetical protein